VVKLAELFTRERLASVVEPSLMVTVPVGNRLSPETYWTSAVIVTGLPTPVVPGLGVRLNVVGIFVIVRVTGADCDEAEPC
jgi:hypothetical protein